jgi:hypothetical protein
MHAKRIRATSLGATRNPLNTRREKTAFPMAKNTSLPVPGGTGTAGKNLRTHLSTDAVDFREDRGMKHLPRDPAAAREFLEHYKRDALGQRAAR